VWERVCNSSDYMVENPLPAVEQGVLGGGDELSINTKN